MTDNDIIKALEYCVGKEHKCDICPCYDNDDGLCRGLDHFDTYQLITRQKAEIERLQGEVKEKTETIDFLKDQVVGWGKDYCEIKSLYVDFKAEHIETIKAIKNCKAEAIKEFAERLKERIHIKEIRDVYGKKIDNLVKEMVGDV